MSPPKRVHTTDKRIKLDFASQIYQFRYRGVDKSLDTKDFAIAQSKADILEDKLDDLGTKSYQFRVIDILGEYIKERTEDVRRKNIRQATLTEIEYLFRTKLTPFFGKKRLGEINERTWAAYCRQAGVSDLKNHRKVFRLFLAWCKRNQYLKALPDVTDIPYHKKRKRRILKPDEITLIFKHARGSLLLFLSMALFNSMRRKEIMTMSWDRANLDESYFVLRDDDTKTDDGREFPMNSEVRALLIARKRSQVELGLKTRWVFPNRDDWGRHGAIDGLKTAYNNAVKKSGFERGHFTWHDFRATFEKYSHKSVDHTDTQREKFSGASIDVQKNVYVSMTHEDLRGLEQVVNVEGLKEMIAHKIQTPGEFLGKGLKK